MLTVIHEAAEYEMDDSEEEQLAVISTVTINGSRHHRPRHPSHPNSTTVSVTVTPPKPSSTQYRDQQQKQQTYYHTTAAPVPPLDEDEELEEDDDDDEDDDEYHDCGDSSSRSVSPAPTIQSITDSLIASLSFTKHGRTVNATNPTYSMAVDDGEATRQSNEHKLYKLLFHHMYGNPLYIGPVDELLAHEPGSLEGDKIVMDFGTGTADWAIDMAKRFPHVQVLGIDVSPMAPDADSLPLNCRIEVDDLNLDISHYYSTTSLIHIRLLAAGIKDYPGLIEQAVRCLLPRGLLNILETDFRPYKAPHVNALMEKPPKNPLSPDYCASAHWLGCLSTAMHRKMANCDAGPNLRRWVGQNRDLEVVEYYDWFLPVFSIFPNETRQHKVWNEIARMVSADFIQYMDSARPLLLDEFSVIQLDSLERQVLAEIRKPKRPLFIRVVILCARRRSR